MAQALLIARTPRGPLISRGRGRDLEHLHYTPPRDARNPRRESVGATKDPRAKAKASQSGIDRLERGSRKLSGCYRGGPWVFRLERGGDRSMAEMIEQCDWVTVFQTWDGRGAF